MPRAPDQTGRVPFQPMDLARVLPVVERDQRNETVVFPLLLIAVPARQPARRACVALRMPFSADNTSCIFYRCHKGRGHCGQPQILRVEPAFLLAHLSRGAPASRHVSRVHYA